MLKPPLRIEVHVILDNNRQEIAMRVNLDITKPTSLAEVGDAIQRAAYNAFQAGINELKGAEDART